MYSWLLGRIGDRDRLRRILHDTDDEPAPRTGHTEQEEAESAAAFMAAMAGRVA